MAYVITDECTACGLCAQVCPNDAIVALEPIYRIEPLYCTECVGYAETARCVEVCPPGAIVPASDVIYKTAARRRYWEKSDERPAH